MWLQYKSDADLIMNTVRKFLEQERKSEKEGKRSASPENGVSDGTAGQDVLGAVLATERNV